MGGGKQGVLESVFFLLAYALGGGLLFTRCPCLSRPDKASKQ